MTKKFRSREKKKDIIMKERKSGRFMNKLEYKKLRIWKNSSSRVDLQKKGLMEAFWAQKNNIKYQNNFLISQSCKKEWKRKWSIILSNPNNPSKNYLKTKI